MGANRSLLHVVHLNTTAAISSSIVRTESQQKTNKSLELRKLKIEDKYYEREKRWRCVIEEVDDIVQEMDELTEFSSVNAI